MKEDMIRMFIFGLSLSQGKLFCRSDDNAHPQLCVVDPKSLEVHSASKMDGEFRLSLCCGE